MHCAALSVLLLALVAAFVSAHPSEELEEAKRANFAFAKRGSFAFAKRRMPAFAFAKRGMSSFAKRAAFAKRASFAKRSDEEDELSPEEYEELVSESKRGRSGFAFAKRAPSAFAKRAQFAFAKRGLSGFAKKASFAKRQPSPE